MNFFIIALFHLLPKNLMSRLVGLFTAYRFHPSWMKWINHYFVKIFSINMAESAAGLENYGSIGEVFTRTLKSDARPLASSPVVFPCDGTLSVCRQLKKNTVSEVENLFQAKGLVYSQQELLGKKVIEDLTYHATIYLAPHNYHRIHSPVQGSIMSITHIQGSLWPVNRFFVPFFPGLFCQNERLVFTIRSEQGFMVYVVMVGAFNVGKMTTPFLKDFETNRPINSQVKEYHFPQGLSIKAADELGVFHLGSTVIMLFEEEAMKHFAHVSLKEGNSVLMGQAF